MYTNPRISPKKKKRKYSISRHVFSNTAKNSVNFIVNIVDRVLDLNKYDSSTGLYTLCRDWINATSSIENSTNVKVQCFTDEKIDETESNEYQIKHLPEPTKIKISSFDFLNKNINSNIRETEKNDFEIIKSLNLNEKNVFLETKALLRCHTNRWKLVRKEWKKLYKEENLAYKNSFDILQSIFEDN
jgi:hypothetical protein